MTLTKDYKVFSDNTEVFGRSTEETESTEHYSLLSNPNYIPSIVCYFKVFNRDHVSKFYVCFQFRV